MLSLLYRADQAPAAAEPSVEQALASADVAPTSTQTPSTGAEALTKRAQAERAYAELSATGAPPSSAQLAAAANLSASYARALVAEFQVRPPVAGQPNRQLVSSRASAAIDAEQQH